MTVVTFGSAADLSTASAERLRSRRFIALGVVVFGLLLVSPALDAASANPANAQTQMQLNKEACDEYKRADGEMNSVYRRITREYRGDAGFIAALKKAQLAW